MKSLIRMTGILVLVLASVGGAGAQEKDKDKAEGAPAAPSPDDVVTGQVRISMNSDYAKLRVDGNEWEEHEFLDGGRTVVVSSLRRTESHTITLTPIYAELAAQELVIKADDWKLATIGKNEKMWRVERKVTFAKGPTPPPKPVTRPK